MPHRTIPSAVRRIGLRAAALAVPAVFVAATAGPAIVEEERSILCSMVAVPRGDDPSVLADVGDDDDMIPRGITPPDLPPVLEEIAEHVRPVLATDSSHDIPNAARAHDAELDREAAEGMTAAPPPAGPNEGEERAVADVDESIAEARARLTRGAGPRPAVGLGPRRRR